MNGQRSIRWFALPAWMLSVGAMAPAPGAAGADFWLSGEDPAVQMQKHKDVPNDYMDMFEPDAPWQASASGLNVFKISMQMALHGTDAQLRAIIEGLKQRHIHLALEMAVLEGSERCGNGVEGYASPAGAVTAALRIKRLGGQVAYIAMDEPVWFGHIFVQGSGGRVGCRYRLTMLADRVAAKLTALRQVFPELKIGDIEPINAKAGGERSIDDIMEFENLLHEKTQLSPEFVHADVSWSVPGWPSMLKELARRLRARGYRYGLICDGDDGATGNEEWVRQALEQCKAAAVDRESRPEEFIVQSWSRLPTKMLPETTAGTLTYALRRAELALH